MCVLNCARWRLWLCPVFATVFHERRMAACSNHSQEPQSIPPCFPTPPPLHCCSALLGLGLAKIQMFSMSFWMKTMPLGFLDTLSRHDCRLRNCHSAPVMFACLTRFPSVLWLSCPSGRVKCLAGNKENKSIYLVELNLSSLRSLWMDCAVSSVAVLKSTGGSRHDNGQRVTGTLPRN